MSYDFITHAKLHGVVIDKLRESSKQIFRCGTEEHPKRKNGAYFFDGDRGWVQAWDGDCEIYWWDDPTRAAPTPAELEERRRRQQQREEEQARLWGKAAVKCIALERSAKVMEHNYLHRKGLGDVKGLVLPDEGGKFSPTNQLFVPMRNFRKGNVCGGQKIFFDYEARKWDKKYVFGSQPKGAAYVIGPTTQVDEVVLVEGYATGLSVDKALKQMCLRATVLVCFNDSNLINIAKEVSGIKRKYIFADHDKSAAGESAAQAAGLPYCMSPVEGEDANDLHVRAGLTPVCELIRQVRAPKPVQLECDDPILKAMLEAA